MGMADALQEILRVSSNNAMVTLQRLQEEVQLLSEMIALHRWLVEIGPTEPGSRREKAVRDLCVYAAFAYTAAVKAAIECQSFSLPALERLAIDCLLHAARIAVSEEAEQVWSDRHAEFYARVKADAETAGIDEFMALDTGGRRATQSQFQRSRLEAAVREILEEAPNQNGTAAAVMRFYTMAIDLGAHPNVLMTISNADANAVPGDPAKRAMVHRMMHGDVERVRAEAHVLLQLGVVLSHLIIALLPFADEKREATGRLHAFRDRSVGLVRTASCNEPR